MQIHVQCLYRDDNQEIFSIYWYTMTKKMQPIRKQERHCILGGLPKQVDREFKDGRSGLLWHQMSMILVTWLY